MRSGLSTRIEAIIVDRPPCSENKSSNTESLSLAHLALGRKQSTKHIKVVFDDSKYSDSGS